MADAPYVGPNLGPLAPSGTPSGVQFIPDAPVGGKFIPDAPQAQTAQPAFIPDDHPHAQSLLEGALSPFTRYPGAYHDLRTEAQKQVLGGIDQLTGNTDEEKHGAWEKVKGAGNVAAGAVNYTLSPVNAGVRTVVGEPVENVTGIPKEYTEFAASLAIPGVGLTKFTKTGQTVATKVGEAGKVAEKIFSPDTVDAAAQSVAADLRAAGGEAARDTRTTDAKLEPFRAAVNQMDDPSKLAFINHVEGVTQGPLRGPLQGLADTMRQEFQLRAAKIQALPSKAQMDFIDDYFPHFWKDPQAAQQFAQNFAGGAGKQGSGASLKARTVPTISDGIAAGLQPAVTDPVEATMRYVTSMDKFIAATKVLDDAKAAGTVIYRRPQVMGASGNPASFKIPPGYAPLKGRGATDAMGAQAYAPENWARVYNNFISRGFAEIGGGEYGHAYDVARRGANSITALELGLSGYHALTMAKEGIVNGVARGISELASGHPVMAAKSVVQGVASPIAGAIKGRRLAKVYTGQGMGTPMQRNIAELLTTAGGRGAGFKHATDYEFSGAGSYVTAWKRAALKMEMLSDYNKAQTGVLPAASVAAKNIGRIMDTIAQPLFEKYIPYMKNGAFQENMQSWLDRNPTATRAQQVAEARKIWDSIDNRFGEMVQDNVFWDKTLKQSAMLLLRSWSWTIGGVVREIGGGARDFGRAARGGPWTDKMSYVIALPMVDAGVNAVYQYLKTGEPPKDVHDLIAPRTGGVDVSSGEPERLQTPGYMKDVYGFMDHPGQEMTNKIGTGPRLLGEAASVALGGKGGADWRNDPIISPPNKDEPLTNNVPRWLGEYAQYLTKNIGPISVRQYIEGRKAGSNISAFEKALGVKTAPANITDPEGHANMMLGMRQKAWRDKLRHDKREQQKHEE